jgi:hypothetical protein
VLEPVGQRFLVAWLRPPIFLWADVLTRPRLQRRLTVNRDDCVPDLDLVSRQANDTLDEVDRIIAR